MLVIKDLDSLTLAALQATAARNGRCLDPEIAWILAAYLRTANASGSKTPQLVPLLAQTGHAHWSLGVTRGLSHRRPVLSKASRRLGRYADSVACASTGAAAGAATELFGAVSLGAAFLAATFLAEGFFFAAESVTTSTGACFLAAGATFLAAGATFLAARSTLFEAGAAFLADTAPLLAAGTGFCTSGAACLATCFTGIFTAFFAADFAAGFEAVAATLAVAFLAPTGAFATGSAALIPLLSIKNASRFFALAIQPGARPKPDHCLPVFGSAYFATEAAFAFTCFTAPLLVTA